MPKLTLVLIGFVVASLLGVANAQRAPKSAWPPLLVCDAPKGQAFTIATNEGDLMRALGKPISPSGWKDDGVRRQNI